MAPKCKNSDAGNSDMPKRNHELLPVSVPYYYYFIIIIIIIIIIGGTRVWTQGLMITR
jgi:hypothetical protein